MAFVRIHLSNVLTIYIQTRTCSNTHWHVIWNMHAEQKNKPCYLLNDWDSLKSHISMISSNKLK